MPVLFIGHGSPMNALEENSFSRFLNNLVYKIPKPKCILVISAHWLTDGTWITEMQMPRTIHDMYGFPKELYDIQYPAPGHPKLAQEIKKLIMPIFVNGDLSDWGLDHGSWSILKHIYPNANIPVLQLSIDQQKPSEYHFKIGQKIATLRDQGVLIIGSGNIVHNLKYLNWHPNAKPLDWAVEFDEWVKLKLQNGDHIALIKDFNKTKAGQLSVPTIDHYYPLNYVLGASDINDELYFEYEEIQNASISMRSIRFEPR